MLRALKERKRTMRLERKRTQCPTLSYTAAQSAFPYMVKLTVQWWREGSTLTEDALPPPFFLSRYIINLCLQRVWRAQSRRSELVVLTGHLSLRQAKQLTGCPVPPPPPAAAAPRQLPPWTTAVE